MLSCLGRPIDYALFPIQTIFQNDPENLSLLIIKKIQFKKWTNFKSTVTG